MNGIDPLGLYDCETDLDAPGCADGGEGGGGGCAYDVCVIGTPDPPPIYNGDYQYGCSNIVDGICQDFNFTIFKQVDASGWQINKFRMRGPSIVTGTITQLSRVDCAAGYGNQTSLASQARIQGDNAMGKVGQVLLSNTFSGIVDFGHTVANATNAAPVYMGLLTNGARLGLPGGGVISQGVLGKAQDAGLQAVFSNLGTEAASTAAATVGYLKAGYDFATFAYGYIVVCH